ncbi:MAG: hypothetical protein UZ21_OP11001000001, partial [Microgenomates bacterium OLB22]
MRRLGILIGVGVGFCLALFAAYFVITRTGTASANSPELREESREFERDYRNQLKKHLRPSQLETLSSGSGCICGLLRDVRNADWASDECKAEARRLYRELCSQEQNQCDDDRNKDRDRHRERDRKKDKPRHAEATPTDEHEDRDKDEDRKRRRRRPRATDEWPTPWAPSLRRITFMILASRSQVSVTHLIPLIQMSRSLPMTPPSHPDAVSDRSLRR